MNHSLKKAHGNHSRSYGSNRYVYPVISRRSRGLSIGVNLNIGKNCNFDCAYCQVERKDQPLRRETVDLEILERELKEILSDVQSTGLSMHPTIGKLPSENRILRDIALSGDGEATLAAEFTEVCNLLSVLQKDLDIDIPKLILITNASLLHHSAVQKGLNYLTQKKGEIWGKLDAGTARWFRKVERSILNLEKIQQNLENCVKNHPLTLQSLFCTLEGETPSSEEIECYLNRVKKIVTAGEGNFRGVQVYSLARHPSAIECGPVSTDFLQSIADKIRSQTGTVAQVF